MKVRIDDKYDLEKTVTPYYTEVPDQVGRFALELIDRHANVAGHQDGEDSTGRAKLRLQTVEELVKRSFDIAELAFQTARERGHMVALPDLNEINAEYDASREVKRRERLEKEAAQRAAKVA